MEAMATVSTIVTSWKKREIMTRCIPMQEFTVTVDHHRYGLYAQHVMAKSKTLINFSIAFKNLNISSTHSGVSISASSYIGTNT
jgi:hypothetical protein